jgi:lipoprotein signal peptidase
MLPFIFILLILLDQVSKYLAEHFLVNEKIYILGDFLVLSFVKNTGVAFSFPIQGMVLKILTVALIVGISAYYIRAEPYKNLLRTKFAYVFILS